MSSQLEQCETLKWNWEHGWECGRMQMIPVPSTLLVKGWKTDISHPSSLLILSVITLRASPAPSHSLYPSLFNDWISRVTVHARHLGTEGLRVLINASLALKVNTLRRELLRFGGGAQQIRKNPKYFWHFSCGTTGNLLHYKPVVTPINKIWSANTFEVFLQPCQSYNYLSPNASNSGSHGETLIKIRILLLWCCGEANIWV